MPKDACYHKVKARYKVFPSAYASGAIAKCRKVGAANYGTGGKKKKKKKTIKKAEGGIIAAIDNPKRPPPKKFKPGGVVAAGCGVVDSSKRKITRTF
tara:strand:- start:409 stop:699 length:291 start_codon:yes stop_codon:yes gene_type:complete